MNICFDKKKYEIVIWKIKSIIQWKIILSCIVDTIIDDYNGELIGCECRILFYFFFLQNFFILLTFDDSIFFPIHHFFLFDQLYSIVFFFFFSFVSVNVIRLSYLYIKNTEYDDYSLHRIWERNRWEKYDFSLTPPTHPHTHTKCLTITLFSYNFLSLSVCVCVFVYMLHVFQ